MTHIEYTETEVNDPSILNEWITAYITSGYSVQRANRSEDFVRNKVRFIVKLYPGREIHLIGPAIATTM